MTTSRPSLDPADISYIYKLLIAAFPKGRFYLFGSRVLDTAKPYSDLDICLDLGRPMTLTERTKLVTAFSDSDLSYHVDLLDYAGVSDAFRAVIDAQKQPIERFL